VVVCVAKELIIHRASGSIHGFLQSWGVANLRVLLRMKRWLGQVSCAMTKPCREGQSAEKARANLFTPPHP
jgi:hypothetical protein